MTKIEKEKRMVAEMIALYCQRRHSSAGAQLCPECRELLTYAHQRLTRCKFGEAKTTCRRCPIHCYKPAMRQRIACVMRYAGPRLLFHHPLTVLRHWF